MLSPLLLLMLMPRLDTMVDTTATVLTAMDLDTTDMATPMLDTATTMARGVPMLSPLLMPRLDTTADTTDTVPMAMATPTTDTDTVPMATATPMPTTTESKQL